MKNEFDELKPRYEAVIRKRESLSKQVSTFDKDTMGLRNAKGCLKDLNAKKTLIKDNNDQMMTQYRTVEKEKNEMQEKFEDAIKALRSKTNFKNDVLEQKLNVF